MANIQIRTVDSYVYRKTDDGLRFLLLKRRKAKMYAHIWQGVAGKIKTGEKAWQAALRELKEETELTPIRLFVADQISNFYEAHTDRIDLVPVFGIEVDSDQVVLSDEHCDYRWVSISDALETLVWRGQKMGIATVNEMVIKNDDRLKWTEIHLMNKEESC